VLVLGVGGGDVRGGEVLDGGCMVGCWCLVLGVGVDRGVAVLGGGWSAFCSQFFVLGAS
jgi:hypothetical protein